MLELYNAILYQPLLNALVWLYKTIAFGDFGAAVILLTILIRLILYPIFQKTVEHQAALQEIQPKLKKVQEDHKHDKEKQAQAMLAVYREHRVNPLSGFFLLLLQLPILIALYQIFLDSTHPGFPEKGLYSFIGSPGPIDTRFLGLIDLKGPSILIVGLAAVAQYFQGRLALPKVEKGQTAERIARTMTFVGPILTVLIFYRLPAAISLYWTVTSLFSILQQQHVSSNHAKRKLGNIRNGAP